MWESLIAGIWLGLGISLLIGPLFLTLLDTTIERGKFAGFAVILGISLSDVAMAAGAYYGLHNFADQPGYQQLAGFAGSGILSLFGVILLTTKYKNGERETLRYNTISRYFFRGVIINVFNPFTILLWVSLATARINANDSLESRVMFYGGLLGIVAVADVIKVILANKLRSILTESGINTVRKLSGSAICIFGIILLVRTIMI